MNPSKRTVTTARALVRGPVRQLVRRLVPGITLALLSLGCAGENDTGDSMMATTPSTTPTTPDTSMMAGTPTPVVDPSMPVDTSMPTTPTATEPATPTPTDPIPPEPAAPTGDPTMIIDDSMCSGIRGDAACPLIGTCAGRACGIADTGTRDCVCGTEMTWSCQSCTFPMGADQPSILVPPAAGTDLDPCGADVVEDTPCANMGDRCGAADGDMCACWLTDDEGVTIWDCDSRPNFW